MRSSWLVAWALVLFVGCDAAPTTRDSGTQVDAEPGGGDAGSDAGADGGPRFDAGSSDAGSVDAGRLDAGPVDGGPLAMCPEPGVPLPEVAYLDRPAGAFDDPPSCTGCPGEISFASLFSTPGGTVATLEVDVARDGSATTCTVAVVSECGRAVFEIPWSEFGRPARTVPLFCGQNRLIVTCENDEGASVRVSDPITAAPCAAGAIRATLTWDECGSDHELHIVRNGSQLYDPANDCTWNACTYGGGLDWPPMGSPDGDAAKDIDDTGVSGIENGRVSDAAPGTYHVLVEMWGSLQSGCVSTGSAISLFVDEVAVASMTQPLGRHFVWYVGVIDMPSGTFTSAADLGARTTTAPVTDCTAAWGTTIGGLSGCTLPIPAAL